MGNDCRSAVFPEIIDQSDRVAIILKAGKEPKLQCVEGANDSSFGDQVDEFEFLSRAN
jgi:hypothetical protein